MSRKTSTELTVSERASAVLKFDERKAELATLAKNSAAIVEIRDSDSYQECHSARMVLKNTRVTIQKVGKEARDDAVKFSKEVIAKEKELIGIIEPEENRLQAMQDQFDAIKQAEKDAKIRAEQAKIEAERAALQAIKDMPLSAVGQPAVVIAELIEHAKTVDLSRFEGAALVMAEVLRDESIAKLVEIHTAEVAAAQERAKVAAERAELEALRKRQEAEAAEAKAKADEERRVADAAAQAERDRLAAEDKARRDAEAAKLAAERAETERKQAAESERLRLDREKLERDQAEAEKAERARVIAAATLDEAASEAVIFLEHLGYKDHLVTAKLRAAIARESKKEAA